jgi:S1-C subfamily serine protease
MIILNGPPRGAALGAQPPGVGGAEAAFASLRLPDQAPFGAGRSQVLGALERAAAIEPWRPRTNPERMRGAAGRLYPRIAPATVVVRSAVGHGTGFVIAPDGWILTNHHVVDGAAVDEATGARVVSVHWGQIEDGRMRVVDEGIPALVYKASKDKDLALLKLRSLPRDVATLPVIPLADRVPAIGEDCVAIGHPAYGTLWTIRSGEIAGIGSWPREMIDVIMRRLSLPAGDRAKLDRTLSEAPPRKVVIST